MQRPLITRLLEKATHLRQSPYLTFTMIHPTDRKQRVPSRHIPTRNIDDIYKTLELIRQCNAMGWGAYVGIGYRKNALPRYTRGGKSDIVALPALFADVDRPPEQVLPQLKTVPEPSILISSGGGTHIYWILESPTTDLEAAEEALKGIAIWLKADTTMTSDQIMRLPGTKNTKPHRNNANCEILSYTSSEYTLDDFFPYAVLTTPLAPQWRHLSKTVRRTNQHPSDKHQLNLTLSEVILRELEMKYSAIRKPNGWYACYCPFDHSRDKYPGDHAFYRPDIGLFNCFGKHGQFLNHELATELHINVNDYGGIYAE